MAWICFFGGQDGAGVADRPGPRFPSDAICSRTVGMRAIVPSDHVLRFGGRDYPASVGWGGRRVDKREGDGATPVALLPLRQVLYRADRVAPPATLVPVWALERDDGWCDDPGSD